MTSKGKIRISITIYIYCNFLYIYIYTQYIIPSKKDIEPLKKYL